MKLSNLFLLISLGAIIVSCNNDSTGTETTAPPAPVQTVPVPRFDRDSAFFYVEKQLSFGPRVTGSEGHLACKEWLVNTLSAFGASVIEQNFDAKVYTGASLPATNIIAQFNPDHTNRIVLAAHWDSRHIADSPLATERRDEPILGADDGASGVAVLLEIARQLGQNPIDMGVDIVLFDAEDYGQDSKDEEQLNDQQREQRANTWALGAQYWAANLHRNKKDFEYGILLDMVGAEGARFPKEGWSMYYAKSVVNKVWALANKMGYSNYFVDQQDRGGVTDDHYFVNKIAGIPMIDIINKPLNSDTGFGPHWHTHNDNIDIIDSRTLRAVGQLVLAVVYRENNGQM